MLASAQQDLEEAVHELDDVLKDYGAALPPDLRVRLERSRALIVSACGKLVRASASAGALVTR